MADKTETSVPTLTERVRIDGAPAKASLAADGTLRWSSGEGGERCLALESEGLGLDVVGRRITIRAFVGALKGLSSCGGRRGAGKRVRRDHVLEMPTEELASRWSERMRAYIDSLGRPKRLLIIVNPFGGNKSARKIFDTEIKPLLADAEVLYTLKETKYQLHAQEIANTMDLIKYDGIVCVSGDGVLVEVVNGLLHREDWDTAIQVPLGVIPAGTGNGMAKSLLDAAGEVYSVSNATFSIIRGYRRTLDVVTISQEKTKFFSVLMLTWGLVADIDIESEKYRWMGSARLDFYSLLRIINLRKYNGHVQFVPAPGYEAYGEPINQTNCCSSNTMLYKDDQGDEANVRPCGYQGPSISLDGCEWRSIDGPFISVWINNVPWASEDIMPAPNAKFSDGYLDAVIIKECPKSALLSLMLKMSDGSYCKSPYVVYLKVKAFRLEPGKQVGHPTKGGIIDSDGEVIARGDDLHCEDQQQNLMMAYGPPIQMTVDQGLATIFSPR
ncbi:sphingosine kinase 2 [Musa acuminata AAA Group]|uniref:sphingosine kinase n=2 Tax=Musa acuminata subsp. malaccensis TaxID=214687 RepID=A0A804IVN1_MUSAM|nr:PREDICTED: sphingosine kinase 2 [Musa acuminata subsp. malaccensis]CAG1843834.1 unnamed protein product [Musa acuminata subsp. malaccensis]